MSRIPWSKPAGGRSRRPKSRPLLGPTRCTPYLIPMGPMNSPIAPRGALAAPAATNAAIAKYMNTRKVPQLFVATGATRFGDPKNFPWTMGWQPTYQTEGRIYAKFLLANHPNGKIGVLYQNDDSGKDYLKGLKDGL